MLTSKGCCFLLFSIRRVVQHPQPPASSCVSLVFVRMPSTQSGGPLETSKGCKFLVLPLGVIVTAAITCVETVDWQ